MTSKNNEYKNNDYKIIIDYKIMTDYKLMTFPKQITGNGRILRCNFLYDLRIYQFLLPRALNQQSCILLDRNYHIKFLSNRIKYVGYSGGGKMMCLLLKIKNGTCCPDQTNAGITLCQKRMQVHVCCLTKDEERSCICY